MTSSTDSTPSLAEWAGGGAALNHLFRRFYERVREDEILSIVFRDMAPNHAARVAAFVEEVLGGEDRYSAMGGSHMLMISHHVGRHLGHRQRRAWVALLLDTADEIGLPDDPEFRACLVGYLEWGSRLAVINSNADTIEEKVGPMPNWTWSSPGGPYRIVTVPPNGRAKLTYSVRNPVDAEN